MENCLGNSANIYSPKIGIFSLGARNFGFSVKIFLEMFRRTSWMPSWPTRSLCVQFKFFAKNSRERILIELSSRNSFQNGLWARRFHVWHPWRIIVQKRTILFHSSSENEFKSYFFLRQKLHFSQKDFLVTWNAFLANLSTIFPQTTVQFSIRARKFTKFGFSQKVVPLER